MEEVWGEIRSGQARPQVAAGEGGRGRGASSCCGRSK